MKLICEKYQLQEALNLVGRTVSSRTTLPILECILFIAEDGVGITLCANDMEMSITTTPIPADISVSGSVALNAKLFSEIIRKMPGDYIDIETDEKLITICKSGQAKLEISGLPAEEFPAIPQEEMERASDGYNIKAVTLKDMIKQTIFSVSLDPSKAVLTGELLEIAENTLRVVAVDMFRISYRSINLEGDCPDNSAVVPAKALNELSRAISGDNEEEITFSFTEKRAIFSTSHFTLSARLLEGDFIRYNQIFSKDFTTMMVVNRQQLLGSLERSVLVAMENRQISITLDIKDDQLIITSKSEKGHTYDEIPCETDGTDMTIYFNPRYLLDALKAIEEESIVLKFNTSRSPCTIESLTGETITQYKYLIVPLRGPA
ncbi:MAG: DNA polymerase III subunit beta [Defluviitaleaceae bacterium]|nr:DNA polymerase III subunit beta [Defluviitaleaceae bacterium]